MRRKRATEVPGDFYFFSLAPVIRAALTPTSVPSRPRAERAHYKVFCLCGVCKHCNVCNVLCNSTETFGEKLKPRRGTVFFCWTFPYLLSKVRPSLSEFFFCYLFGHTIAGETTENVRINKALKLWILTIFCRSWNCSCCDELKASKSKLEEENKAMKRNLEDHIQEKQRREEILESKETEL